MDLNLTGKSAIVTGNSEGIGRSITQFLQEEGVFVFPVSRSIGIDLMTTKGIDKIYPYLERCEILVHNVGGLGSDKSLWKECIHKNYEIMVELTKTFLSFGKVWGRVIAISSIYGKEKGLNPGFAAAKAAQIAYMKSLSGTVQGTTFNVVCPGYIEVGKFIPTEVRYIGRPQDVGNIVTFLCSYRANFIDGAIITCDGGLSHAF